jgi:tetratricopeptide (TPR) repeat protein
MRSCRFLHLLTLLFLTLLLGACAQAPKQPVALDALFDDARFGAPPLPAVEPLFALSPAMRRFVQEDMRSPIRLHGAQGGLFHALRAGGFLNIEYESSRTRTAAEAFEARSGNCLSLVLMTAALARELGLRVEYHLVNVPDIWTRSEHFVLLNGHVNISLGPGLSHGARVMASSQIIDFQPVQDPHLMRVMPLAEHTLVAMFFNNRAVELMEAGDTRAAYAALRAALRSDPRHVNALNTLAVLYRRADQPLQAERVLRQVMEMDPANRHAASNLALVLRSLGRPLEAQQIEAQLPPPPFEAFERGLRLAAQGQWAEALNAFEQQLRLAPDFHGAHYQLARAHYQLGHLREAQRHFNEAADSAPNQPLRDRYRAKLRALRQAS